MLAASLTEIVLSASLTEIVLAFGVLPEVATLLRRQFAAPRFDLGTWLSFLEIQARIG